MDYPAGWHLMEMVREINDIGRRARSGAPGVDDYLRAVTSDPTTEWFTALLREKSANLERETQRADQLACALRAWYGAKQTRMSDVSVNEADFQLVNTLRAMGIVDA
jgi:hypothetical protein